MKKSKFTSLVLAATITLTPFTSLGHGGKTDASGGHRDNKNVSGLGYYHYHCGGYPPHLHTNGCPYRTNKSSSSNRQNVRNIQSKLNELGYNCGKVDGISGKKTKAAIRRFQKEKGLVVDGIAGVNTKKAMGLN